MKQYKIRSGLFCCFLVFTLLFSVVAFAKEPSANTVYLGGMPFGVRFHAGEVSVLRLQSFASDGESVSPAADSGICVGDVLQSVNARAVSSVEDVIAAMETVNGAAVEVTLLRGDKKINTQITPRKSDETGKFQLGILLKDSSAGIGTVTYVHTDSLEFAGLGHGICSMEDGKLLKIDDGYICNVKINGVHKGLPGTPGELRGTLEKEQCGRMTANAEVGVFGVFENVPRNTGALTEIAKREEVHTGDATIFCTLDDNVKREYAIQILEVDPDHSAQTKNFVIKVSDERLLDKTGGIVQGMSGSPIIQDGKLVGAVTHVLVNDPTRGYGIFIENMLEAANTVVEEHQIKDAS